MVAEAEWVQRGEMAGSFERQVLGERFKGTARAEHGALVICGQWMAEETDITAKMKLARQTWDEGRHAMAFYKRARQLGANIGIEPPRSAVLAPLGPMLLLARDTVERTTVLNRCVEALAIEGFATTKPLVDPESAEMLDFVIADEVSHVQLGQWAVQYFCKTPEDLARVAEFQGRCEELLAQGRQAAAKELEQQTLEGCSPY
jgi:hypothetical protein